MARTAHAGPICGSQLLSWIDTGTLCRTQSNMPGPVSRLRAWFAESLSWGSDVHAAPSEAEFVGNADGQPISDEDYEEAAAQLGASAAAIKAVAKVESAGGGFDERNRPKILYERHLFSRYTKRKHDKLHPDISNRTGGGYGEAQDQYPKLVRAMALDRAAALKSASWGKFQILGSNHLAAGFPTVDAFVKAMKTSETAQLKAFVNFINADPAMKKALQEHDWAGFAAKYNGPAYKKFKYDQKIKKAYDAFEGSDITSPKTKAPVAAPPRPSLLDRRTLP